MFAALTRAYKRTWAAVAVLLAPLGGCDPDSLADDVDLPSGEKAALESLRRDAGVEPKGFMVVTGHDVIKGCCGVRLRDGHVVELQIRSTELSSLAPLTDLPRLERADLSENRIDELGELDGCAVKHLDLHGNPLPSVDGLSGCTELHTLGLGSEALTSLAGIAALKRLATLSVSKSKLTAVPEVAKCKLLSTLSIAESPLTDLAALTGHATLERINLRKTEVKSLAAVHGLAELQSLSVEHSSVASLAGLRDLPKLTKLTVRDSPLADVDGLAELSALRDVDFRNTKLTRFPEALRERYREVRLEGTPAEKQRDDERREAAEAHEAAHTVAELPDIAGGVRRMSKKCSRKLDNLVKCEGSIGELRGVYALELTARDEQPTGGVRVEVETGEVRVYMKSGDRFVFADARPREPAKTGGRFVPMGHGGDLTSEYGIVLEARGGIAKGVRFVTD